MDSCTSYLNKLSAYLHKYDISNWIIITNLTFYIKNNVHIFTYLKKPKINIPLKTLLLLKM